MNQDIFNSPTFVNRKKNSNYEAQFQPNPPTVSYQDPRQIISPYRFTTGFPNSEEKVYFHSNMPKKVVSDIK